MAKFFMGFPIFSYQRLSVSMKFPTIPPINTRSIWF